MKSTFGGLNTVVRGLYAQQVSLDTVGHNISNTNTDGYSRQGVNLSTTRPESIYTANGENQSGTGVNVQSVTRARDIYIDRQMWKEGASLGYGQAISTTLGKIEELFHEPSDKGVQTTLNNFWKSWQNLATNASDNGMRTVVRQRGVEIVDSIQHMAQQLVDMAGDANEVIKIKVKNINQINSEICSLNKQITVIEAGGTDHANDLRDRRDLLVDQLSKMVDITINEDKYGNYSIQSGNVSLVDGLSYQTLDYTTTTDKDYGYPIVNVVKQGSTTPLNFRNGELQGLIESRDSEEFGVKAYLNKLNTVSQFLLQNFNEQHRAGYGADNSTGNNFFGDAAINYQDAAQFTPSVNNQWLNQLKVNPALFTTSPNGLDKIAGKTTLAAPATTYVSNVSQSNASGGLAEVTSNYTGGTTQNITVRIPTPASSSLNPSGAVLQLEYSLDGTTWTAATALSGTPPSGFTIPIGGSTTTVVIGANTNNAVSNTYTFTVGQGSNVSPIVQSRTEGGNATISSNYTGVNAQSIQTRIASVSSGAVASLEYSLGNGVWQTATPIYSAATAVPVPPGTTPSGFSFMIGSSTVKVSVASNSSNQVGDIYSFSVGQGNASGDNAVKMANRLKTDTFELLGKSSLDTFYNSMIGTLGVQSQNATRLSENQTTLVNQIENWRQSISGVNIDEEMSNMIRFQKGYNAAARVLTSMDEMLDKLINGTGVVGR